jgi:hypothetical protein
MLGMILFYRFRPRCAQLPRPACHAFFFPFAENENPLSNAVAALRFRPHAR